MGAAEAAGGTLARAKVNLYLHVTGRRPDGYHELDSLFVRTGLADRLTLAPAASDGLELSGPFAAALQGEPVAANLALRAVEAVRRACGARGGVAVTLEKNVPVAAGLGGGSADAAAALRAADALYDARLGEEGLARLAAGLGADVPACLQDVPLAVAGIGERTAPVAGLPPFALVLVNPGVPLATADVFRALAGRCGDARPMEAPAGFEGLVAELADRRNDLEAPAGELVPAIPEILGLLRGLPGIRLARMSGSGATCFGLVADLPTAIAVAAAVRRARPAWWCAATDALV